MENTNNKSNMDESSVTEKKSVFSDGAKQSIKQNMNIDVDSELFSPMIDFVFKRIFTADEIRSKTALIAFINSIMEYENDEKIVDLTIVNPQIPVDKSAHKKSIFDIRAKYNSGEQIIIEMQRETAPDFRKRSQHIISKAYASQEISGYDYNKLKKCYLICITNFDIINGTASYITDYRYRDRNGNDLSDDETIVYLDLSKITEILEKDVSDMTAVEKWLLFFRYAPDGSKREIINAILEKEEGIKMAKNVLLEISKDEEARSYYESELIFALDQQGRFNHAKNEGKLEGKLEMVRNLLKMGVPIEQIAEASEKSIAEIEALKND